jgi:hypothetical protein
VVRNLRFSQDTSDSPHLGSLTSTEALSIGPSGARVPDTGIRGHAVSEHVDTHHTVG